jgi:hypothetical protein
VAGLAPKAGLLQEGQVDNNQRETINPDWKKLLAKTLLTLGIIKDGYHGQVIVDITHGGIGSIRRTEVLK